MPGVIVDAGDTAYQRSLTGFCRVGKVMVFTGAGMSAKSGIPTFRDRLTELWAHSDPIHPGPSVPPVICPVCDGYAVWNACDPYADRSDLQAIELRAGPVPRCLCCGVSLRQDVVWLGEPLEPAVLEAAWNAVEACDLLIAVGASLEVEPAASLPWRVLHKGADDRGQPGRRPSRWPDTATSVLVVVPPKFYQRCCVT